jgi:anti-anti-sigma factor
VFVNRGWTGFTGRGTDADLGEGWRAGLHAEDRSRYDAVVGEALAAGRGWEVEFRLRRGDGAHHWLLERAVPIGAGESLAGYVGSCTDINAQYRETERQTLLAALGAALDRETTVTEQLGDLARLIVESRLADLATVRLVQDDGSLRVVGVAGLDRATEELLAALAPDTGLGVRVLDEGSGVLEAEVDLPAAARSRDPLVERFGVRSRVAVPLTVRGRVLAVLGLGRRGDAPAYNDDDRLLAEEIAGRAALSLDNALLLAEERAAAQRLGLLQRVTAELSAATTPVEVAVAAASHIAQLTGSQARVAVYEFDAAQRSLQVLTTAGLPLEDLWQHVPLQVPAAITTAVVDRRPLWLESLEDRAGAQGLPDGQAESVAASGVQSEVALPLIVAGRVVGVVGIGFPARRRFAATERGMLLAVAEQCAQALDRARLYRAEQDIAEILQRSLLPQDLPRLPRLALSAEYLPGAEGTSAGGDWYDVLELPGSRVAVAVGDVVGQGPAAAAVMGQLRSALSAALLQGTQPADALDLLDRFAARLPGALASTAVCVVVDWRAGTITWARAGHPPPLLITGEGPRLLDPVSGDSAGPVLGVPDRAPYGEATARIAPGDTLLLYTDGLVERRGEHLDAGLDRLAVAAGELAAADPATLTRQLLDRMLAGSGQPDDVAVIAVRLIPPPLAGRIPADPTRLSAVRRAVVRWSAAAGLPEEPAEDLQLALGEALANAVEHAYPGPEPGECRYSLERRADGTIDVCVEDDGVWRPQPADRGHRGRGLELIRGLATHVEVGRTTGPDGAEGSGTRVRFRLPAAGTPHAGAVRRAPTDPGPERGARLEIHEGPDGVQLAIVGELDLATAGELRDRLQARVAALTPGTVATVDLRHTGYLASAGIGLFMELRAQARDRGAELRISAEAGSVPARILALTGIGDTVSRASS